MSAIISRLVAMVSLAAVLISGAWAQPLDQPVRVATFVLPPFVMQQGRALNGFSIELWNEVAVRIGVKTRYQMTSDVKTLFDSLRSGNADIAVSGLFYSTERDREFDFSYPIMEVGLQIMVRDKGEAAAPALLRSLLELVFSRTSLAWLGAALFLVVLAAHIMWFLERRQEGETITGGTYFPGILHAMHWAATTLLTQGDQSPRQWFTRTLGVLWMFIGIVFIAFYTAQLTTTLTVNQIEGAINGPEDLPGKRVATLVGGTPVAYLREHNAVVQEFSQSSEVYQALLDGKVDAVVQGSAGLDYYSAHEGKGLVKMVGPEFNKNDVGFVFPLNSPLRKKVNGALLSMREDGTYQRIYDKWFGAK
ncbi:Membrane-bound lytic murein transglycosylase F [Paraburkholderia domus]|jgi:ABC-type amino acid transport/signal transduction systems, periplasmic component/domain|uniref:transporter substrate-binding domain-containing protein n=1 Tax=Paraburkholderia domus TaxID=2793075 RepID=UPI001911BF1E|nr:transporter substrate-binding domain-containing protein [Paraburkholderia domus]MBK5052232.1 transporter substrate-binding domain-containing protein [Burkholderia sp. R-70006]MBK5064387.1 transporter substrate-binding domain-containing protein [Burkholderia sp. R-70199]MBK5089146.1 transporter substrate-binding domain-containing protein [Burkholderia sp. R-69927]MBK5122619.1 transporter substrate-binding domain-containing protein [Burkholderia sp. R-69980]MBK5183466.1 transporter substrate-